MQPLNASNGLSLRPHGLQVVRLRPDTSDIEQQRQHAKFFAVKSADTVKNSISQESPYDRRKQHS
jgi:hypothetical protein